jgi:superfamily II DNA or RNA helicase
MSRLLHVGDFDQFAKVKDLPPASVKREVLAAVRRMDEADCLQPAILSALYDPNVVAHGPAEVADVLTHRVTVRGQAGLAAFVLKGKSFPRVRPVHVSHQIYRLRKIDGLRYAVLAVVGDLLDQAKEEFVSTAIAIGCDYAILDANDIARVLVALGFLCPRDGNRIIAGRCPCGYRPELRQLNVLQQEALERLGDAHRLGQSAGLVVMPTGSGKTRVAVRDVRRSGARSVFYIAHTQEILDVAEEEFSAAFGADNVKRIRSPADARSPHPIKIGTVQLLSRHVTDVCAESAQYVVVDEFHHAAARSYRTLVQSLRPEFLLGLTATPFREDRQDVLDLCGGNLIVSFELRMGVESGILVPYHYHGCFDDVDYTGIRHNGRCYSVRDLERALIIPERDDAIVGKWRELGEGRPTVAFCCSHAHAQRMSEVFNEAGTPASCYLAHTPLRDRRKLVRQLREGAIRVLCTVDVLNEGADFPFVECLLFLRPTESKRIFFQQLGRGLRRWPGKLAVVVIDFIGNFRNAYRVVEYHGLTPFEHEPETYRLGGRTPKDVLNLPLGCSVRFDSRVIDLFERQVADPGRITRHNIARVLIYRYHRLCRRMGKLCTQKDVDRHSILPAELYRLVFGSWREFQELMRKEPHMQAYCQPKGE